MQASIKKWFDLNKAALATSQKWFDINSNLMLGLAQQHIDLVNIYVESGNKQVQALVQVKGMQEAVNTQTDLNNEFKKKFLNNLRVTVDILLDTKKQLTEWAESNLKQANEWNAAPAK
jgi:hypothetical protein